MSFDCNVKIYYKDTDAGGIVYHANYLQYGEIARCEYLNSLGLARRDIYGIVVTEANLKYRKPAVLGDELTIKTNLVKIGPASCEFSQNIYRDDVLLVEMEIKVAFVNQELKPIRIPQNVRQILEKDKK